MGNDPIPIGCTALKPIERHGMDAVSWFLYDKNTGAIMGRTPLSWLLITIFYIVYYAFLAGFWALMLLAFFQFIDDKEPRWQQDSSRIGRSPALGVRPGQTWDHIDSSIIMFNKENEANIEGKVVPGYGGWVKRTNEFLEPYKKADGLDDCSEGSKGGVCQFKLETLGACSGATDQNYGYDTGSPCILLKLNRIFGLEHDYYEENALHEDMPEELKNRIQGATNKKQVWVSCKGENVADRESLGDISYFPADGGFPDYYFPYLNQEGYQSPIIAVQFKESEVGQFFHVECRAWAQNILYHRRDRVGIAHFELQVHTTATAAKVV